MMDREQDDLRERRMGVRAPAEASPEPLEPLLEDYAREMGELPGPRMMALGFLDDAHLTPGWSTQTVEVQQAVGKARALAASVMIRLLSDQDTCGCTNVRGNAAKIGALLDRLPGTVGRSTAS